MEIHDEILACFDDEGNRIASKSRSEIHTRPLSIWHAVVNIWLINSSGEILCSKRASHLEGNPNKWQTYFGGHVCADDSFTETAIKELVEEVGLEIKKNQLNLIDEGRREEFMHLYKNYFVLFNSETDKLNFSDGEITEVKFYKFNEYLEEKKKLPEQWCNSITETQYQRIKEKMIK